MDSCAQETISLLQTAYRMELETVTNYLANSIHLDGVDAVEVKRALDSDVLEELNHAKMLAHRIKQLGGRIPGSLELVFDQQSLSPPEDPLNIAPVIQGVIDAERSAIEHYLNIIQHSAKGDPVTADLATRILADEEEHRTLFEGFLAGLPSRSAW
jgi:bacterioferritin